MKTTSDMNVPRVVWDLLTVSRHLESVPGRLIGRGQRRQRLAIRTFPVGALLGAVLARTLGSLLALLSPRAVNAMTVRAGGAWFGGMTATSRSRGARAGAGTAE